MEGESEALKPCKEGKGHILDPSRMRTSPSVAPGRKASVHCADSWESGRRQRCCLDLVELTVLWSTLEPQKQRKMDKVTIGGVNEVPES